MLGVLMFLNGMGSANLVEVHMMVNRYWLPDLVLGSGPTQSTKTWLRVLPLQVLELTEPLGGID